MNRLGTDGAGRTLTHYATRQLDQKHSFGCKIKGFMRDPPSKKDRKFMAEWIGYGVAIGCGIGVICGNTVLSIGPGVAIGVAIGRSILKSRC